MKSETEIKMLIVLLREKLKESKSKPDPVDIEKGLKKRLSEMNIEKSITFMEWVLE
jgi:hypothetical protein